MPQSSTSPVFPPDRFDELREELDYPLEAESDREGSLPELADDTGALDWLNDLSLSLNEPTTRLILLVVIGLLGFFIYRTVTTLSLKRKTEASEDDPLEVDIQAEERMVAEGVDQNLLELAEHRRQFSVSVRLLYIQLLKELQDGEYLRYRRDYSNQDYQRQLGNSPFLADFRAVTGDYERFWYGEYALDLLSYRQVKGKFTRLFERIREARAPQIDHYA